MNGKKKRIAALLTVFVGGLLAVGDASVHATYSGTNGRIAYLTSESASPFCGSLAIMNADGTVDEVIPSVDDYCLGFANNPSIDWSPDGSRIAISGAPEFRTNIFTMKPDGTDIRRLTNDNVSTNATYTNNGKIVFESFDGAANRQIFDVNVDGTSRRQLTTLATPHTSPAQSPNGAVLMYVRDGDIYFQAPTPAAAASQHYNSPPGTTIVDVDWHPDGNNIVFTQVNNATGNGDIFTKPVGNANAVNLTSSANEDDRNPSVSPDGTRVLYDSDAVGNNQLFSVPTAGGAKVRMTNNQFADAFGDWGTAAATTEPAPLQERGAFNALNGFRALDTRNGTGGINRPINGTETVEIQITGVGGVPAGAASVTGVLTVVDPQGGPGFTTLYANEPRPTTSTTNFQPRVNVATSFTVKLAANGKIKLFHGNDKTSHYVIDVTGYTM